MEENKRICTKCGTTYELGQKYCASCGQSTEINLDTDAPVADNATTVVQHALKKSDVFKNILSKYSIPFLVLNIIMIVCFIVSIAMFSKGQDKINNYYNSEDYPILNENAYVGGDAYNYIINANYATGYYVLSAGFMVVGTMCGCTGQIINNKSKNETNNATNDKENI